MSCATVTLRCSSTVVDGVEVPADWHAQMQAHAVLKRYLVRGHYDPSGANRAVPTLVPIKCLRNIPSHGREDAGDANTPFFTRADIARSVYDKMPLALCSMAKSKDLELDLLFPGRTCFHQSG